MKESSVEEFTLVFHIGAGKTGSSSIQYSLSNTIEDLHSYGYDYWGLMLERAPLLRYDWQKPSGSKAFLSLTTNEARIQISDVLSTSVRQAIENGYKCAVWSNEWFFGRHENVIPALKELESEGAKVRIVAYVRRHDSWARSAYLQWGIKHKSYPGPIRPFKQYIKERPVRFSGSLRPWQAAFPRTFTLRNFDAIEDAVQDFQKILKLPENIPLARVNESPGNEELLLRAIYNNFRDGEVMPAEFDRAIQSPRIDFSLDAIEWMTSLLPDKDDLREVLEGSEEDRQLVNAMLTECGQPDLSTDPVEHRGFQINQERIISYILQILTRQSIKITKLQKEIKELKRENEEMSRVS